MIGITISVDQLRSAPNEVRRWIEGEVTAALALPTPPKSTGQESEGLAACSSEEVAAIFLLIKEVVPAVNVFFEIGHQGIQVADAPLKAYQLVDLLRHARARNVEQLLALLDLINGALQRIRGNRDVSLYGLDGHGHCFVAAQNQPEHS